MLHRLLRRWEKAHQTGCQPVRMEGLEARCLMSVTPAPVTFVATEGAKFNGSVAAFTSNDVGQPTAHQFISSVDWGDGTSSMARVKADPSNPGRFLVMGQHKYADDGSYDVKVSVTDLVDGTQVNMGSEAQVADAPLRANRKTVHASALKPLTAMVAQFHDFNRLAPIGDFTATIDWGDGSPVPSAGTVVADGQGNFRVLGTHTYATKGSFNITVTIVDAGGSSATVMSTANVKL